MSEFKEELAADVTNDNGLTNKDEAFLDVLFDKCKGDIRRAMDMSGFPKDMPTSAITKRLSNQIKERSKEFLVSNTAKAVIGLTDVMNDPTAPGNKVLVTAAKEILDRGGVFKEETLTVQSEQNMFILPPKQSQEDLDE